MLCYFTVIQTDLDDFGLRTVRHFQISSWLEYKQVVCDRFIHYQYHIFQINLLTRAPQFNLEGF